MSQTGSMSHVNFPCCQMTMCTNRQFSIKNLKFKTFKINKNLKNL